MNLFADPKKKRGFEGQGGIRQTAAAESRFAGMLTPEEEKLMRGDYQRIRVNTRGSGRGAWHIDMTIFPNRQSAGI